MLHSTTRRALLYPKEFAPTDISGCKLWLDFSDVNTLFTDAGVTKVSSDGDLIYRINDKSGNDFHHSYIGVGYKPVYKVNIKNGLSAGQTNPSGTTILNNAMSGNGLNNNNITIFAVGYVDSSTGARTISSFDYRQLEFRTVIVFYGDGTNYTFKSATYFPMSEWSQSVVNIGSGVMNAWRNGSQIVTNYSMTYLSNLTATHAIFVRSNNSDGMVGYLSEIIYYSGGLSSGDQLAVATYLNTKWGIY